MGVEDARGLQRPEPAADRPAISAPNASGTSSCPWPVNGAEPPSLREERRCEASPSCSCGDVFRNRCTERAKASVRPGQISAASERVESERTRLCFRLPWEREKYLFYLRKNTHTKPHTTSLVFKAEPETSPQRGFLCRRPRCGSCHCSRPFARELGRPSPRCLAHLMWSLQLINTGERCLGDGFLVDFLALWARVPSGVCPRALPGPGEPPRWSRTRPQPRGSSGAGPSLTPAFRLVPPAHRPLGHLIPGGWRRALGSSSPAPTPS